MLFRINYQTHVCLRFSPQLELQSGYKTPSRSFRNLTFIWIPSTKLINRSVERVAKYLQYFSEIKVFGAYIVIELLYFASEYK